MANEKRLIDANVLKKELRTDKGADAVGHSIVKLLKIDTIIEEQPTIDAVEVVRCKDCKHREKFWTQMVCPYYEDRDVDDDHFCAYGERKDNGKE